jgi:hypothetical protein
MAGTKSDAELNTDSPHDTPVVDIMIDVATGHLTGFSLVGKERET